VPITASDLHNFRVRATAYSLRKDTTLQRQDVTDLLNFKELGQVELECFQSEVAVTTVKEILRQTMQDTGEIWVVEKFLQNMKSRVDGFDFRIPRDPEGRPVGVVWMTKEMRRSWLRYGHAIFLDAQKRKMNKLHWAYIGPTVLDSENTIEVACESLMIEESHQSSAFVLNALFEMEPRRSRKSITVIFGDCLVTDSLLPLIGLDKNNTAVFWDHYHLKEQVWKKALPPSIYTLVIDNLVKMINASTKEKYDYQWDLIKSYLAPHQDILSYLTRFYEKPERITTYCLDKVSLSLGKRGSSHAEQQHSSHVAYLGSGGAKEIEDHIFGLIQRQTERVAQKRSRDFKHSQRSSLCAEKENNEAKSLAMATLSCYAYDAKYMASLEDSVHYTVTTMDNGCKRIKRKGASEESLRMIFPGHRCDCPDVIAEGVQCKHEFALDGCFVKENGIHGGFRAMLYSYRI
jgi:hypothetical protein